MPGREQNGFMPAIPSPPSRIRLSRSTERQSVEATNEKERVWIIGWESLNTTVCPDEVFKLKSIFTRIVQVLDILEGVTDAI